MADIPMEIIKELYEAHATCWTEEKGSEEGCLLAKRLEELIWIYDDEISSQE